MKPARASFIALITSMLAWTAVAAPTKINSCPRTLTQPGAYELQDNLDAVGDCIVIQADFVTVNLNGFRIRGNGTGSAITDQRAASPGARGTMVRNGTVTNFENAIELLNGTVEDVRAVGNHNVGILVIDGTVRNCIAEGNANNHGISTSGGLLTGNVSINNYSGISASHGSSVTGNTVRHNTHGGVLTIGTGVVVANNAVFDNGAFGIKVDCPSLVLGNTAVLHATNALMVGAGCTSEHNAGF